MRAAAQLLERDQELLRLGEWLQEARHGQGRLVLVAGEAGIGKSSLVRAFLDQLPPGGPSLTGYCDNLTTPPAFGPLADMGIVARELESGDREAVRRAFLAELAHRRPGTVVVLEDLHWADQATIELLHFAGRRLHAYPTLVIATYRDDEVVAEHPLRAALGRVAAAPAVRRLRLAPLSAAAVALLSGGDPGDLHRRTGGNPFYVTEVLAAGRGELPGGVADAVIARMEPLSAEARAALELLAVAGERIEGWLLESLGVAPAALSECRRSGLLGADRESVWFRHQIAQAAVLAGLSPARLVELHRRVLPALLAAGPRPEHVARLVEHAQAAGDGPAVVRFGREAATRSYDLGSFTESIAQLRRVLGWSDLLSDAERADALYEIGVAAEALPGRQVEGVEALGQAADLRAKLGDAVGEGSARARRSRLQIWAGRLPEATAEARRAVALLEAAAPGSLDLGVALAHLAHTLGAGSLPEWEQLAERAHEIGVAHRDRALTAYALNLRGTAQATAGDEAAVPTLLEALAEAERGQQEVGGEGPPRYQMWTARLNLIGVLLSQMRLHEAEPHFEAATAMADEFPFMVLGEALLLQQRAFAQLQLGNWTEAAATADRLLSEPDLADYFRCGPHLYRGLVRARRGDPDTWADLDEALSRAPHDQWRAEVHAGRAEAAVLGGDPDRARLEAEGAIRMGGSDDPWRAGALLTLPVELGETISAATVAPPYALELAGDHEAAAAAWSGLGCPYEEAWTLARSPEHGHRQRALEIFQQLGARPAAAIVARDLRALGYAPRRGPQAATRRDVHGLTRREAEVLELMRSGLTDAEIAQRLFLSPRTVSHHVASILGKLGVKSRRAAARVER